MLSNIDILNAIKSGDLIVEPFDENDLKPNALSMHLDNELAVPLSGEIDPIEHEDLSEN
jgi:deoxycytidine triphosphate deaminase